MIAKKTVKPTNGKAAVEAIHTLEQNETIISLGLKAYETVGLALEEIRVNKQYVKVYGTGINWTSYLKTRWNMSLDYASDLVKAAKVVKTLTLQGVKKEEQPKNASKALAVDKKAKELAKKAGRVEPTAADYNKANTEVTKQPRKKRTSQKRTNATNDTPAKKESHRFDLAHWSEELTQKANEYIKYKLVTPKELVDEGISTLNKWYKVQSVKAAGIKKAA